MAPDRSVQRIAVAPLGLGRQKSKIPSTKSQTNSRSKIANSKRACRPGPAFRSLVLRIWDLFGIWNLGFGIPASGRLQIARILLAALLLPACGCESDRENRLPAASYYLSPYKDLHQIGRVALVELAGLSDDLQIATTVTDALFLEVQKKQVFGVMVVPRSDPAWPDRQENLDSSQTLGQLVATREALKCNGLLVGTLTKYQPYPHMVIGLRLKLLDLTDGQLLWGMEEVWDSSDKSIQKRIQNYLKEDRKAGDSPLREELVIVSPLSFCKFVTYEVASTFERTERK
jgi:hypothetical protein